jgi:hypothetical protein
MGFNSGFKGVTFMKLITFQPNIQSDILRQQKCCVLARNILPVLVSVAAETSDKLNCIASHPENPVVTAKRTSNFAKDYLLFCKLQAAMICTGGHI